MFHGSYKLETGKWQAPASFDTEREAEDSLAYHAHGRGFIVITDVYIDFFQCDECDKPLSGTAYMTESIKRGVYCSPECIVKAMSQTD